MMDLRFDQVRQVYLSVEHCSWLIGGSECETTSRLRQAQLQAQLQARDKLVP
jgi:hypothetical protein